MRLTNIEVLQSPPGETDMILVSFRSGGLPADLTAAVPDGWTEMAREEKIGYVRDLVTTWLAHRTIASANSIIYPDLEAPDAARDGFQSLPGWVDWTPAEAESWINTSVTDLATAKQVLSKMAAAITYLRDIVIQR